MANDDELAMEGVKEEAEAYNSYRKKARLASSEHTKDVLEDIADEELVHLGEFSEVAEKARPEMAEKVKEGYKEAKEMKKSATESIEKARGDMPMMTHRDYENEKADFLRGQDYHETAHLDNDNVNRKQYSRNDGHTLFEVTEPYFDNDGIEHRLVEWWSTLDPRSKNYVYKQLMDIDSKLKMETNSITPSDYYHETGHKSATEQIDKSMLTQQYADLRRGYAKNMAESPVDKPQIGDGIRPAVFDEEAENKAKEYDKAMKSIPSFKEIMDSKITKWVNPKYKGKSTYDLGRSLDDGSVEQGSVDYYDIKDEIRARLKAKQVDNAEQMNAHGGIHYTSTSDPVEHVERSTMPSFRSMMGLDKPIVKSGGGLYNHSAFGVAYIGGGKKDNSLTTKRRYANRDDETGKFTTKKFEVEGCTKKDVNLKEVKHLEKSWGGIDNGNWTGNIKNIGPYKFMEDAYGDWYSKSGRYCIRQADSGWIVQDTFVDNGPEVLKLGNGPDGNEDRIVEFIKDGSDDHLEMDNQGDGGDQDFRASQNNSDTVMSGTQSQEKISKSELVDFLNGFKKKKITKAIFRGRHIYGEPVKDIARNTLEEGSVDTYAVKTIRDRDGQEHRGVIMNMGPIDKYIAKGPGYDAHEVLVNIKNNTPYIQLGEAMKWVYGEDGNWYKVHGKEVPRTDENGRPILDKNGHPIIDIRTVFNGGLSTGYLGKQKNPFTGKQMNTSSLSGTTDYKTRKYLDDLRTKTREVAMSGKKVDIVKDMNDEAWDDIFSRYIREAYNVFKAKMFGRYYEPDFYFDNSELNNKIIDDLLKSRELNKITVGKSIVRFLKDIGYVNLDRDGIEIGGPIDLLTLHPKALNIMFALGGAMPALGEDGNPENGVKAYRIKYQNLFNTDVGKQELKRLMKTTRVTDMSYELCKMAATANIGLAGIFTSKSDQFKYQYRNSNATPLWKDIVYDNIKKGIKTNDTSMIINTLKEYNLSDLDDVAKMIREHMREKYISFGLDASPSGWKINKKNDIKRQLKAEGRYSDDEFNKLYAIAVKEHNKEQEELKSQMNSRVNDVLINITNDVPELMNVRSFVIRGQNSDADAYLPDMDWEVNILANMQHEQNLNNGEASRPMADLRDDIRVLLKDKLGVQREFAEAQGFNDVKSMMGSKRGRKQTENIDMSELGGVKGWTADIKDDSPVMQMWPFYMLMDKAWNNKEYYDMYDDDGNKRPSVDDDTDDEVDIVDNDISKSSTAFMKFVNAIHKSDNLDWIKPLVSGTAIRKADQDDKPVKDDGIRDLGDGKYVDGIGNIRKKKRFDIRVPWPDARDAYLRAIGIDPDEKIDGMMTPAEIAARRYVDAENKGKHAEFIKTLMDLADWFDKYKLAAKGFDPRRHEPFLTIEDMYPGQFPEFEWLTHFREKNALADIDDMKKEMALKEAIKEKGEDGVRRDVAMNFANKGKADPVVYKHIMDRIRAEVDEQNRQWELKHPGEKNHFSVFEQPENVEVQPASEETPKNPEPEVQDKPDKFQGPRFVMRTESGKEIKDDKDLADALRNKKDIDDSIPKRRRGLRNY